MAHEVQIDADINAYTQHSEAFAVTTHGTWKSLFFVSPVTELQLGAGGQLGTLNALSARSPADQGLVGVVPPGNVDLAGADASEALSHDLDADWRVGQTASSRWLKTTDTSGAADLVTSTIDASGGGSATRSFREDAFTGDLGASYLVFHNGSASNDQPNQITSRARLQWRHDLAPSWSSLLEAGGVAVKATTGGGSPITEPVGGATLTYTPLWGQAAVSVRRDVAPNLFIAQNTVTDSASANLSLPLPWLRRIKQEPTTYFAASGGYTRTRLIDANGGGTQGRFDSWLGDASLQYNPRRNVGFALRYQFVRQSGDDSSAAVISGFARNTITVSVSLRFPDRIVAAVPRRGSQRADGADLTPIDGTVNTSVNGDTAPGSTR